ncbi:glycerol kinase 3-like isoform X3 [Diabrotica undecimpunctata]|uniref:glycerol kinase 3-like isoform X3 n=1 Tax=Diabrotica undecimpunctata TaxID=50387 RepID=UPI003B633288
MFSDSATDSSEENENYLIMSTDTRRKYGPLIGAIDEGTSSTRFLVFASKTAEVLTYHQVDIPSIVPKEGWFEQDPMLILHAVKETIEVTCDNLEKLNIDYADIVSVGITNQRETTVLWDKNTGLPLCNAIVWMDIRTSSTVDEILQNGKRRQDFLQNICGLPVSTYFSALKIKWMMDNVPGVKKAIDEDRCLFGNIDTWLIWNLTGGTDCGMHITDVTNASRTMLMNIETLQWDKKLCDVFGIPMKILPEIKSSSEIYGVIVMDMKLSGVPIAGILGDQQAALVGQMCLKSGQAKSTYGTGCFILYNTGYSIVRSKHGLLTTVGYQFGKKVKPVYALEGSVAIAGISITWLRDNLQIIKDVSESSEVAQSVDATGEVVFVPAFSGLYAPYWRKDARSVICGITDETKPGHFVKAALEAVCFQVRDVLEAMALDCRYPLQKLLVDGGMTKNDYLMQMQADYCGIPVVRPTMTETTSLGAAIAAGIAEGIEVWQIDKILPVPCDNFTPQISENLRDIKYSRWKMAIDRSLGWAKPAKSNAALNLPRMVKWDDENSERKIASAVPAGLFVIGAAAIIVISEILNKP